MTLRSLFESMASLRFLRLLMPTRLRQAIIRRRLSRLYGLKVAGHQDPIQVMASTFGRHCRIASPIYISDSSIGDFSYVEPFCRLCSTDMGRFCSIAPFCMIGPPSHPVDHVSTHPAFFLRCEYYGYTLLDESRDDWEGVRTRIGNDVWLGAGAFVRRGVSIADGAVIGAGAVVTSDVPPYAVVGGVPARIIRYRFDHATISRLLRLEWWNRDAHWLRQYAHLFSDVGRVLAEVEPQEQTA